MSWLFKNSFLHHVQHIAKQRVPGLPNDLMKKGKHFILIRNPLHILVSRESFPYLGCYMSHIKKSLLNQFVCHTVSFKRALIFYILLREYFLPCQELHKFWKFCFPLRHCILKSFDAFFSHLLTRLCLQPFWSWVWQN